VGEKSCWSPSIRLPAGKSVSPRAVIAPLTPSPSAATSPSPSAHAMLPCPFRRRRFPPLPHHAVNAPAMSSRNVVTRCVGIATAR
jgi:hypothetical protein